MEDQTEGIGIETDLPFEQVVVRTRIALRANGFGIISEMPAPASIGEAGRQHLFLSVWDRPVAIANLGGQGLDVGDHLHCHVVVYEQSPSTIVAALDPEGSVADPGVASGLRAALDEVFAQLSAAEAD